MERILDEPFIGVADCKVRIEVDGGGVHPQITCTDRMKRPHFKGIGSSFSNDFCESVPHFIGGFVSKGHCAY